MFKPPANWSISDNRLVYVEDEDHSKITLVKLFRDKEPILYKFTLPENFIKGQAHESFDTSTPTIKIDAAIEAQRSKLFDQFQPEN